MICRTIPLIWGSPALRSRAHASFTSVQTRRVSQDRLVDDLAGTQGDPPMGGYEESRRNEEKDR